jgi:hypothetical protein
VVWYREHDTSEDRKWICLAAEDAMTDSGGGGTHQIRFGSFGVAGSEAQWYWLYYCDDEETGLQLAQSTTSQVASTLIPQVLSDAPVYVDAGVSVSASDGPGYINDEWDIDTRYDYPIERIYPHLSPSPARRWRSDGVASDVTVAWSFHAIAGEGEEWPSPFLGVYYAGNSGTLLVQTEATPGAGWVTVATIALTTQVAWTRAGTSFELSYSNASCYLEDDELVGMTFATAVPPVTLRTISRQTSGMIAPGTTKRPRIYCDDADGTEGASGTGMVYHPRGLIVVDLNGATPSGIRVLLGDNGDDPVDGYFECGTLIVGPVYVLGWDPSETRGRRWASNTDLRTLPDGSRSARRKGARRQTMDLTWTEGVDLSEVYAHEARYVTAGGADPVATRADSPLVLSGLHEYLDGPGGVLVYIPRLPHSPGPVTVMHRERAGGAVLCRIVSDLDMQTLLGVESESEIVRCSITLAEEV